MVGRKVQKGYLLVFGPETRIFILVMQKENDLIGFGVDGDAVGCFLARWANGS
jgi:hypothetical protein